MQPLLSVIIPVYKVEKYLDECVASVVNQSYKNLEIILVDDGSPDNCGIMCDAWAEKDSRIKVIHKQNQGLGYARNSGIDVAAGEYMTFLDSDDYVNEMMYERLMVTAVSNNSDIAVCGYNVISSTGEVRAYSDFLQPEVFEREDIISLSQDFIRHKGNLASHYEIACRAVFKRSAITARFLSEREIVAEDYHFQIAAVLCASKVSFIPDALFNYRYNSLGLSKTFSFDKFRKAPKLVSELNKLYKKYDMPHAGDYCMLMMTFTTIKQIYSVISDKSERKRLIKQMAENPVWNEIEISYSGLSLKEKLIYFSMQHRLPALLSYVMNFNYALKGLK